ncbi:MAG: gliding motility-associated C-terminal domain-containing protein [Elusimicrobiota bacterium]
MKFKKRILGLGLAVFGLLMGSTVSIYSAPQVQVGVGVRILNPPNAVTNLHAAPVGLTDGDVQLTWTAPSNQNSAPMSYYLVRYALSPATSTLAAEVWWNSAASSERIISSPQSPGTLEFATLSGLTVGLTHYFGIKTVDIDGQISPIDIRTGTVNQAASLPVNTGSTNPPNTPSGFSGVALGTGTIRWIWGTVMGAGYYSLQVSPSNTVITNTSSSQYDESNLTPNTSYSRVIKAGNAYGLSAPSSIYTVYTLANIPSNPAFILIRYNRIQITWQANLNPATTLYRVERSLDGISFSVISLQTSIGYTDNNVNPETNYYYRVIAINGDGIPSVSSPIINTTTPSNTDFLAPDRPLGLKGTLDVTGQAFTLIWENVTKNSDGTPIDDLVGYNIYRKTAITGAATKINPTPLTVTAFADEVNNRTYYYTLRAVDINGNESVDSLIADSSASANVIFNSSDGMSQVLMPSSVNDLLRSAYNKYQVALTLGLQEEPVPSQTEIIRTIRLKLLRADTNQEISDLYFSKPQTVVSVGYALLNGQIVRGNPNIEGTNPTASAGVTPDQLALYWHNGVTWVKVGGTLDTLSQSFKTKTSFLGTYQLRIAARATSLNLDEANVYPKVFTPNGDGLNDRVYLVLENPNDSSIKGEILDLAGRHIANLTPQGIGVGTTLTWDGKDDSGAKVPSGAYIYKIEGEGKTFTGTMAVAR